ALQYVLWFPNLLEQQSYYWEQQFLKISYANAILSNIDKVEGTAEDKKRLTEDAHLVRAYEYFQMTMLYCLPYSEENRNQLGMPLKQTLDYGEDVKRKTLGETMDFIKAELDLALQTSEERVKSRVWRVSRPAALAFAARFYLYLHDYDKALYYADEALKLHSTLVNYETFFEPNMRTFTSNGGTYTQPNGSTDFQFDEFFYSRVMYNHTSNAVPSEKLLGLYDQANDYRYKAFMVEDYSLNRSAVPGWSAYMQFGSIGIISGPSVPEMLLIRAECKARKNDIPGAVTDLNTLRRERYIAGTYTDLTAGTFANAKAATQFVIDERQREFPFTLRWYDIKRINSDPANLLDKITITREFYDFDGVNVNTSQTKTYSLAPGDKRYAWPIPRIDIQLSRGALEQNPYD
ncbi:MAG TPA: RagB/SusD family nutrient uptake outer membrane protein, partial [Parasegetibacter sp.]